MLGRERERGQRCTPLVEEARGRLGGVEGLSGVYSNPPKPSQNQSNNGASKCCGVDDMPPDVRHCVPSTWAGICGHTRAGSNTRSTVLRGREIGRPLGAIEREALRRRGSIFQPGCFPYEGRSRDREKCEVDGEFIRGSVPEYILLAQSVLWGVRVAEVVTM